MVAEVLGTRPVYVSVLMHDGVRYRGNVYLPGSMSLQDLLNDSRGFIPIEQSGTDGGVTIVSKLFIVSIEEANEYGGASLMGSLHAI